MDANVKKILGLVTKAIDSKWTNRSLSAIVISILSYVGPELVEFYKYLEQAREVVNSVPEHVEKFTLVVDSLETRITQLEDRVEELDIRENKKDKVFLEELDRTDTLNYIFEKTNPGNLYHYDEKGHFLTPHYDWKEHLWWIPGERGRKYYLRRDERQD